MSVSILEYPKGKLSQLGVSVEHAATINNAILNGILRLVAVNVALRLSLCHNGRPRVRSTRYMTHASSANIGDRAPDGHQQFSDPPVWPEAPLACTVVDIVAL
jgi:hypothetical protein